MFVSIYIIEKKRLLIMKSKVIRWNLLIGRRLQGINLVWLKMYDGIVVKLTEVGRISEIKKNFVSIGHLE